MTGLGFRVHGIYVTVLLRHCHSFFSSTKIHSLLVRSLTCYTATALAQGSGFRVLRCRLGPCIPKRFFALPHALDVAGHLCWPDLTTLSSYK